MFHDLNLCAKTHKENERIPLLTRAIECELIIIVLLLLLPGKDKFYRIDDHFKTFIFIVEYSGLQWNCLEYCCRWKIAYTNSGELVL
jgi:hypothetical protein